MRRWRGDRGTTAIELPLAVGVLLLPFACLLLALPRWPEAQSVATAAAKEAATLYATAPDPATGAAAAQAAVQQASDSYGQTLTLNLSGDWCRGCTVTADVSVDVPAVVVPFVGSTGTFEWTATSTARIDDFRSFSDGFSNSEGSEDSNSTGGGG